MKYLKLFEQRQTEEEVAEICAQYKLGKKWSINEDGLVDFNGDVDLWGFHLEELPLKFGRVTGGFDCSKNQLTTLKGCPKEVGGYFWCFSNHLTSLQWAPEEIGGAIVAWRNDYLQLPAEYLKEPILEFIIREQYDWNLYRRDGTIHLERLKQMIDWGLESGKVRI